MNPTIKFECPGCGQDFTGDESAEFEKFICPTCKHEFYPKTRKTVISTMPPAFEAPKPAPVPQAPPSAAEDATSDLIHRRLAIRSTAHNIGSVARVLLFVGVAAGIISIIAAIGGNSASIGWLIMLGAFSSAFWFFLVEQVIHIRANTEK